MRAAPPDFKDIPLLIVDDQATMRVLIRSICAGLGFADIDIAASGKEAFELLMKRRHQIVLADWQMTPVSGLDLLRQVREEAKLDETKFLIMTTHVNLSAVIAARKLGVDGYILKPFSPKDIAEKMASVLG